MPKAFRVLGLARHIFAGVCQRIYGYCARIMGGASRKRFQPLTGELPPNSTPEICVEQNLKMGSRSLLG